MIRKLDIKELVCLDQSSKKIEKHLNNQCKLFNTWKSLFQKASYIV